MNSLAFLLAAPAPPPPNAFPWWGFILIVLVILGAILFLVGWSYGKLWVQCYFSRANVTILSLIGMSFRRVNKQIIVTGKIMAMQSGIGSEPETGVTTRRLEAHYLAGGDVLKVIKAIIAAHRADIDLDFDRAAAIDLAGRDVLDAVQTSVYPKVIDCPDPKRSGRATLSAIAKNGVELKVRARVTVRTNLEQLIGGATEETIIARVGEGIITAIGASETHFDVMEKPDKISKAVLDRGLDAQTAFAIVSIDIADIDVGQNIGARLQADQAEADMRVALRQGRGTSGNGPGPRAGNEGPGRAKSGRGGAGRGGGSHGHGRRLPQRNLAHRQRAALRIWVEITSPF